MTTPAINLEAALCDEGYREAHRAGHTIPKAIACPQCRAPAEFKDDLMAARYECAAGHATAAMWADPTVVGHPVAEAEGDRFKENDETHTY